MPRQIALSDRPKHVVTLQNRTILRYKTSPNVTSERREITRDYPCFNLHFYIPFPCNEEILLSKNELVNANEFHFL